MSNQKTALVLGGGGFIGNHLINRLKEKGFWVRAVDLKYPEFNETSADEFIIGDLTDIRVVSRVLFSPNQSSTDDKENSFDEVYQLAADMGGAAYIFTGEHDADVMSNSATINLNVAKIATLMNVKKLFWSSSACIYASFNQEDPNNPKCNEASAYPANPDSEYGWEKLFSERLYLSFYRNYGLNVRIARFHNIFGPMSTYDGGKEKAPAALCRKVIKAIDGTNIEIFGDGKQTRSFLYIDECIDGIFRLMDSDVIEPLNIGSEEMISINDFAEMIINLSGKKLDINNIKGPIGVMGRNSDNKLIFEKLNWKPSKPLIEGVKKLYEWLEVEITKDENSIHNF